MFKWKDKYVIFGEKRVNKKDKFNFLEFEEVLFRIRYGSCLSGFFLSLV